jgi:phospholipid transport system substrate-binding protein
MEKANVTRRSPILRRLAAPLAGAAILLFSSVAFAGPATDLVKDRQSSLFKLLEAPSPDEKKIGAIFDELLDYDALAKGSLGSEWEGLTDAQRAEFTDLLRQLVRQAYERNLKKTLDFDISYEGEKEKNGKTQVDTKARSKTDKREDPVDISYVLEKAGSTFKVVDIITDDVSLVSSYRSQFVKAIKDSGYDGLAKKMKEKIAKGS